MENKECEAFESVFTAENGWDLTCINGCYQNIGTFKAFAGWQAAKKKATPEGFVLVPNDTIMSIYDTCDKALDSDIAYRSALLNIKNDVAQYADSIEAQEQSHDSK
ncbi:hypothetical protein F938_01245 [Acinetobacter bereziniae LMG 1003 = CIP 70.12]|uniref:Uncharacterized protein n=1 Tax=Acinetobacter bereziniae LMG 1003 = CIP 70.12 TaxID=981324 RepID=N9DJ63_ACIBZ|nr:hypothetical protein [Acinetobacter bereziniae]ENV97836.1 hypothetical protein F938_01245 [Acinetobacter bereziniae LMG 1003 = CIP 70.12]MCU4599116.1 hypothetical protein [Acinetobacter bereziniae]